MYMNQTTVKKIALTLVLLLLIIAGLNTQINEQILQLHDETTKRAVISFGIAKGINAVISLIQGTELSLTPAGLGMTFSVGEFLDPLNDMVERFSWIMLLSSASLVIQKFIMSFSALAWIKSVLVATAAFGVIALWIGKLQKAVIFSITARLLLIMVVLRFGVFGIVYMETLSFDTLMAPQYSVATQQLQQTEHKLKTIEQNEQPKFNTKPDGIFDFNYVEEKYDQVIRAFNVRSQLEAISGQIEEAYNQMINLIAIFVFQTILLPLLFSWIFIMLIKWTFSGRFDASGIYKTVISN
jgi:hypothetical protein